MSDNPASRPRVLALAGSMRTGSYNRKLLHNAVAAAEAAGAEVDVADLRVMDFPLYDGDVEARGLPPQVGAFRERVAAVRGLIIASPEYNYSLPGPLKNALDWASRPPTQNVFKDKTAVLLGASPGRFGAVRGLIHLRQVLTALNVWLVPTQVTVANAGSAFDEQDRLKDPQLVQQVERLMARFVDHLSKY